MIIDKLDHDERLRLECLAQAIMSGARGRGDEIVTQAQVFEAYIRGAAPRPVTVVELPDPELT